MTESIPPERLDPKPCSQSTPHPAQIVYTPRTLLALVASTLAFFQPSIAFSQQSSPHLTLQTDAGQTIFHIGERIPLELRFTAPDNKEFQITTASYDRSGRMDYETFEVAPSSGWLDPLADYFHSGHVGGGLSGKATLSSQPTIIPLNLNEWIRFDQPGVYRLTVSTSRVISENSQLNRDAAPPPLKSNTIELHIVAATEEWQRSKFDASLTQLKGSPPSQGIPQPERSNAIADLRFLATPAAIEIMASNLREDRLDLLGQCFLGLIGLPDSMRSRALDALNRRLDDPDFPVSSLFLNTISNVQLSHSTGPQLEERGRLTAAAWQSALQALSRKQGKARADTAQTLLNFPADQLTPQAKAQLAAVLSSSFLDLNEQRQTFQLAYSWDTLRSPGMIPILRRLATKPLKDPGSTTVNPYERRDLKAAALRRWYELDPEGAYREILAEIGSATPSLTAQSLFFLPQQTLPQFESIWANEFLINRDYLQQAALVSLLVRFGTGQSTSQIAAETRKRVGEWACEPQAGALAYLVKFAPDIAAPLLQRAVDARGPGKTACNHALFQSIAAYACGPVLTEAAVASLNDEDPQVPMGALIYLTSHGDKTVQKPIWDRFQRWAEQWSGRQDLLETQAGSGWQERGLGENLAHALIANQGWLADSDLISRVRQLCVGRQVCNQVDQISMIASGSLSRYGVSLLRSDRFESYRIGQYESRSMELFEAKIAQFLPGTNFNLISSSPRNSDQKALEDEAANLFKRHKMTLHTP